MKKNTLPLALFLLTMFLFAMLDISAQSPEKMSYQAVVRDAGNSLVANKQIGMKIDIRQGSPTGNVVYTDIQTPTTNANGLVSVEVGVTAGFETIRWAEGPYFIETNISITPPLTTYTITGVTQLLSVPYALYAKSAGSVATLSTDNGLTVSNGLVNLKPSGHGGASGDVLTTDGNGNATWLAIAASRSVRTVTANVLLTETDEIVVIGGAFTVTLPASPTDGQLLIICSSSSDSSINTNGKYIRLNSTTHPSGNYSLGDLNTLVFFVYESSTSTWHANV